MTHHQVLNRDECDKDDKAYDVIAAHHKLPEGLNYLARRTGPFVAMQQNAASRRQIERQPHQRQQEDQARKHRELNRPENLNRRKQNQHRRRYADRQQ